MGRFPSEHPKGVNSSTALLDRPVGSLPDGTPLRVRPLRPADRCTLAERFQHLSSATRYARFFTLFSELSEPLLDVLVEGVDDHRHVALVLVAEVHPAEEVEVAVGRYLRHEGAPDRAEVAFTVDDPWQGRGCGRALLGALVDHARAGGVRTFTATVLAQNVASLHLLRSTAPVRTRMDGPNVELELDLSAC